MFDLSKSSAGGVLARTAANSMPAGSRTVGRGSDLHSQSAGRFGERCKRPQWCPRQSPGHPEHLGYFVAQETRINVCYITSIVPKSTPRPIFSVTSKGPSLTSEGQTPNPGKSNTDNVTPFPTSLTSALPNQWRTNSTDTG